MTPPTVKLLVWHGPYTGEAENLGDYIAWCGYADTFRAAYVTVYETAPIRSYGTDLRWGGTCRSEWPTLAAAQAEAQRAWEAFILSNLS